MMGHSTPGFGNDVETDGRLWRGPDPGRVIRQPGGRRRTNLLEGRSGPFVSTR